MANKQNIKVGDIIRTNQLGHTYRLAIVASMQSWYIAQGMIDVHFWGESTGSLIQLDSCVLHTRRHNVRKWWLWL